MTNYHDKPWHFAGFIPEIRLKDYEYSVKAWQKSKHLPKVLILNYLEIKGSGFLRELKSVRKLLGDEAVVILSCVGKDRLLDKLRIEDYCKTAELLKAQAVICPDDYIYEIDYPYPTYQDHHFGRILERAETLIEIVKDRFSIIGLIVCTSRSHISSYVKRLKEHGIDDFAYACGDILKRVPTRESFPYIRRFMKYCNGDWKLLLGVDSREILLKLRPPAFSSSGWCFDATRSMVFTNRGRIRNPEMDPVECAYHNLEQSYRLGEETGWSYKRF